VDLSSSYIDLKKNDAGLPLPLFLKKNDAGLPLPLFLSGSLTVEV